MRMETKLERTIVYRYDGHKLCRCIDNLKVPDGIANVVVRQDFDIYVKDLNRKIGGNSRIERFRRKDKPEPPKPPNDPDLFLTRFACLGCKTELSTHAITEMKDWKNGKFQVVRDSAEDEYRERLQAWMEET